MGKTLVDRVVAVVGDEPILRSEIVHLVSQIKGSRALAGIYRVDPKTVTDDIVLKWMLEEKIVHAAVKDMEMPVSDTEVDTQIASIAKQNEMTLEQLSGSLRREGVPFEVYKRNIRAQLERRNIFDKELRRGGGISESEIRRIYEKKAKPELNLVFVEGASPAELQKAKTKITSSKMSLKEISSQFSTDEFGWVNIESLDAKVAKALEASKAGDLVGPINVAGRVRLVYVDGRRVGSEEDFMKMKASLSQEAQADDYEKRFVSWLERKKTELHIVMNPL